MNTFNIPVIPIPNLVFFPHTNIPIFVEDPTYVKMVKDCIEKNLPIALALAEIINTAHESLRASYHPKSICTIGQPILLENLPNGGIKIFVKGQTKIELLDIVQNLPYLVCEARNLIDIEESLLYDDGRIVRLRTILHQWINRHIIDSLERENFLKNITSVYHIVDHVSMFLILDINLRQILLESNSLNERIQILNTLLKGKSPVQEDQLIVSAFMHYENIENTAKVQH